MRHASLLNQFGKTARVLIAVPSQPDAAEFANTLIGALIIAVIQNGMNLMNVESYTQKVVLGLVILGAVMLDLLRHRGWRLQLSAAE